MGWLSEVALQDDSKIDILDYPRARSPAAQIASRFMGAGISTSAEGLQSPSLSRIVSALLLGVSPLGATILSQAADEVGQVDTPLPPAHGALRCSGIRCKVSEQ